MSIMVTGGDAQEAQAGAVLSQHEKVSQHDGSQTAAGGRVEFERDRISAVGFEDGETFPVLHQQ